jgi:hypothetical protein
LDTSGAAKTATSSLDTVAAIKIPFDQLATAKTAISIGAAADGADTMTSSKTVGNTKTSVERMVAVRSLSSPATLDSIFYDYDDLLEQGGDATSVSEYSASTATTNVTVNTNESHPMEKMCGSFLSRLGSATGLNTLLDVLDDEPEEDIEEPAEEESTGLSVVQEEEESESEASNQNEAPGLASSSSSAPPNKPKSTASAFLMAIAMSFSVGDESEASNQNEAPGLALSSSSSSDSPSESKVDTKSTASGFLTAIARSFSRGDELEISAGTSLVESLEQPLQDAVETSREVEYHAWDLENSSEPDGNDNLATKDSSSPSDVKSWPRVFPRKRTSSVESFASNGNRSRSSGETTLAPQFLQTVLNYLWVETSPATTRMRLKQPSTEALMSSIKKTLFPGLPTLTLERHRLVQIHFRMLHNLLSVPLRKTMKVFGTTRIHPWTKEILSNW